MCIQVHMCNQACVCNHVIMNCSVFINEAVEGSGSEGAPKYMGEGVTYGVFLGY